MNPMQMQQASMYARMNGQGQLSPAQQAIQARMQPSQNPPQQTMGGYGAMNGLGSQQPQPGQPQRPGQPGQMPPGQYGQAMQGQYGQPQQPQGQVNPSMYQQQAQQQPRVAPAGNRPVLKY